MRDHTGIGEHWQRRYTENAEDALSWFESEPAVSLDLIKQLGLGPETSLIDIGGGASRLADALLRSGWKDVSVLDISAAALEIAKRRLGMEARSVTWIVADVTSWKAERTFDLWHDRAAFHFLTDPADRAAYVANMTTALRAGGHAIIATFALDGPEKCSGLPIVRYDALALAETVGPGFMPVASQRHEHRTPGGKLQAFMFHILRKI
jgi:SAM-dependent methyltransferase